MERSRHILRKVSQKQRSWSVLSSTMMRSLKTPNINIPTPWDCLHCLKLTRVFKRWRNDIRQYFPDDRPSKPNFVEIIAPETKYKRKRWNSDLRHLAKHRFSKNFGELGTKTIKNPLSEINLMFSLLLQDFPIDCLHLQSKLIQKIGGILPQNTSNVYSHSQNRWNFASKCCNFSAVSRMCVVYCVL